jgi:hypothetical protein
MNRPAGSATSLLTLLTVLLLVAGCSANSGAGSPSTSAGAAVPSSTAPTTSASTSPTSRVNPNPSRSAPESVTPLPVAGSAVVSRLTDAQWQRIVAAGVWRASCPVGRSGLRRVDLPYVGFDGHAHRGALVVNADVAASVVRIFTRLYQQRFPIRRLSPVEAYGGDDNASMAADNTSAFNCRQAGQANAPSAKSPHANGRAIDLNPYENPWRDPRCGCFQPDSYYGTHRNGTGVIVKGGTPWTAFVHEGWIWQDSTTTDFQHFDTGYPSRPLG